MKESAMENKTQKMQKAQEVQKIGQIQERQEKFTCENFEYQVVRSDRKTMTLEVRRDGNIVVRAPLRTGLPRIRRFVNQKQEWVLGCLERTKEYREQKTRWGSCSSEKNLNFNWKLILAPPEVLDYVVVHELCHLKEMNHSKAFWEEVGKVMPEYETHKLWLKENGWRL